jgi:hypothetical protein
MAAVTVGAQEFSVFGNKRVSIYQLSNVQNGFTLATGFNNISYVDFAPTTSASYGVTISGGTITFATGGTLAGRALVIGS